MGKCEPQNLIAKILSIFILSGYTFSVAVLFFKVLFYWTVQYNNN